MPNANNKGNWLLVAVGTLATTGLTVGGQYWLEQQKAKVDLAKEISKTQAAALDKLDRDLTKLKGNVFYMVKLVGIPNSASSLEKQAFDTALVLAEIVQDNKPLDDSFSAKNAIHELDESVAPLVADLADDPTKNASRLQPYYSGEFSLKFDSATKSLEDDRKRVAPPLR
jgi:hypothetical protein